MLFSCCLISKFIDMLKSAPAPLCTMDSSSLGSRRLGHNECLIRRMQQGVGARTTTQWRHWLQRFRHVCVWPIVCRYDVIHKTGSYIVTCISSVRRSTPFRTRYTNRLNLETSRGIRNVPLPLNGVNNFETDQSCCVNLRRELNRQVTKFIIVHLHVNRICELRVINCIHSFIHSFISSVGVSGTTFVDKNDNTNELINW